MAENDQPIPPASNSITSMLNKGNVPTVESHQNILKSEGVVKPEPTITPKPSFNRGDVVRDTEKCLKVVILKEVAKSPKGIPYYKVGDKESGEIYIQRGTKLKR